MEMTNIVLASISPKFMLTRWLLAWIISPLTSQIGFTSMQHFIVNIHSLLLRTSSNKNTPSSIIIHDISSILLTFAERGWILEWCIL